VDIDFVDFVDYVEIFIKNESQLIQFHRVKWFSTNVTQFLFRISNLSPDLTTYVVEVADDIKLEYFDWGTPNFKWFHPCYQKNVLSGDVCCNF
jgi:hypothetical protein